MRTVADMMVSSKGDTCADEAIYATDRRTMAY
jgi:hypothetical protein